MPEHWGGLYVNSMEPWLPACPSRLSGAVPEPSGSDSQQHHITTCLQCPQVALQPCSCPAVQAVAEALAAPGGAYSASQCPENPVQLVPKRDTWLLCSQPLDQRPSAAAWSRLLQALQPALAQSRWATVPAGSTAHAVR